jgi:lipoate-protein ligase A
MPDRQPAYRDRRPHSEFVANLPVRPEALRDVLRNAWDAHDELSIFTEIAKRTEQLATTRYGQAAWNYQR